MADIPLIRQLAGVAFPATYKSIITAEQIDYMMDMMYSTTSLTRQMTEEHHTYLLLYTPENEAAGYVSIQPIADDEYELQKIYVLPRFQGQHLGRELFEAAVAHVKELHPAPCRLFLHVNRHNKARAFYEHLGMHVASQGDYEIGHGYYMNDYIMEKTV